MRTRIVLLFTILCLGFTVFAQPDSTSQRITWFAALHSGALLAKPGNGTTASLLLNQGVRYHRTGLGVGVGYDSYLGWRSMPVSANLSFDLSRRLDRVFFVQVGGGYARAWINEQDEAQLGSEHPGGYFYHPSLGYRIHHGKLTLYFSAGYKVQTLEYERNFISWGWRSTGMRTAIVQKLERLSFQMGIGLR